jgi:hypothetical protein
MPSIFSTWNFQKVVDAFDCVIKDTVGKDGYTANRAFVEQNDHWQNGIYWPSAGTVSPAMKAKILQAVSPQFTPVDAIGEVLDNVANGLLEQEALVTFAPIAPVDPAKTAESEKQAAEIATMVELLSGWWDRVSFWEACRDATRRSRWSTRGALRAWITPARLTDVGQGKKAIPRDLAFVDALAAIQIMSPDPSCGMVYIDRSTQQRAALFTFTNGPKDAEKKSAEIWYIEGDKTIVRIVEDGSDQAQTFEVEMGQRLPMTQMIAKLLIKDSVRRQQNRLNFFETILVRLGETAGFRERYTTNAMPSGAWLDTAPTDGPPLETRTVDGKTWYLHAVPRQLGAAITTDLRGVTVDDPSTGKQSIATPGVTVIEPTDPDFAIRSADHARETILRECKQGHLANQSQAQTSGNAYVQARAVHEKDLNSTKGPLEGMIRDMLESVIALAEFMTKGGSALGEGGSFLKRYRCVVNLHVDAGPVSPDEQAQIVVQYQAGLISDDTAMSRLGVEDTSAEQNAVGKSPMGLAALRAKQGAAIKVLTDAGASLVGAAELVGISGDDAKNLIKTDLNQGNVTP